MDMLKMKMKQLSEKLCSMAIVIEQLTRFRFSYVVFISEKRDTIQQRFSVVLIHFLIHSEIDQTPMAVAIVISLTGLSFYCELLVHDSMLISSSIQMNLIIIRCILYVIFLTFVFVRKNCSLVILKGCTVLFYSITSKRIVYLNNIRTVYQLNGGSTP